MACRYCRSVTLAPAVRILLRQSVRLVFVCLLLAAAAPARAFDPTPVGLRISLLDEFTTGAGSLLAYARYGGAWGLKLGTWIRDVHVVPRAPDVVAGGDYVWSLSKWRFGAGVVWIDRTTNFNGTLWNFNFSASYDLTDRIFCEYQHFSHGSKVGIKTDAPNEGWNLIGIGFIF
jgi:hypothetical protein